VTKKERALVEKAIDLIEINDGSGYHDGMAILYKLAGFEHWTRTAAWKNGADVAVWPNPARATED
jgi:hypothetical protein